MRCFNVMILDPTQSPYEGGVFKLQLFLSKEYQISALYIHNSLKEIVNPIADL
ncbi:putative ubiquitin-conjugating enzyme E2, ubiquitin-conjugating enzyme/RWD [Helianthus annuus]|nr:putative ubiquitin-conjugating enzyme E2, ubiquitin-conjugating enzyme/RWD [Helianthus annuus]KAJ0468714.1 putative ubiquitin-conjugating enzyme E2, ubiquitin-conjugating enzyme/RWD [Helianthus annuus]KAJ0660010.1 putative ubiquitin-conjugating enzyme E2, ubiquitin-conjugating enzyme/RWD [Helianthus annuus]KAJ0840453.1 putative ubiquitin-conjugating enzyme E2, ubiquitin-conjugating enzyme/RWD [Helianthus annuus]KAJ0853834.1 putative ubiquitin-conjugating enzyme E2, ubiquitin-conjugating enzy